MYKYTIMYIGYNSNSGKRICLRTKREGVYLVKSQESIHHKLCSQSYVTK